MYRRFHQPPLVSPLVITRYAQRVLTTHRIPYHEADDQIHRYGRAHDAQNFKDHINDARKFANGLPIWITEFRADGTDDEVKSFLDDVMPWMDNSQDIHRYCYFMARPGPGMLINEAGDGLSDIGNEYNLYHVHPGSDVKGANGERWWEQDRPA